MNKDIRIRHDNELHTIEEWAALYAVDVSELKARYEQTGNLEEALKANGKERKRYIEYNGQVHTMKEWAVILDIPYSCIRSRFNCLHWSVKKTFETPYTKGEKND